MSGSRLELLVIIAWHSARTCSHSVINLVKDSLSPSRKHRGKGSQLRSWRASRHGGRGWEDAHYFAQRSSLETYLRDKNTFKWHLRKINSVYTNKSLSNPARTSGELKFPKKQFFFTLVHLSFQLTWRNEWMCLLNWTKVLVQLPIIYCGIISV